MLIKPQLNILIYVKVVKYLEGQNIHFNPARGLWVKGKTFSLLRLFFSYFSN